MQQQRRILPRFGLRSILVLTTIVAVVCGVWIRQAIVQREVSKQLEQMGVELMMGEAPQWLRWLPAAVLSYDGGHYFCPVIAAQVSGSRVTNHDFPLLPLIGKLPQLKTLHLEKTALQNESLAGLAHCRKLENLHLIAGGFTNVDVVAIPRMNHLKRLDISQNTKCSDLPSEFPNLLELSLDATAFSDEGMVQVAKFKKLETLSLSGTRVSDEGISSIISLTNLAILDLTGSMVTGKRLSELRSLRSISLGDTALTEQHFVEICKLPMLTGLDVQNCRSITEAGLEGLVASGTLENLDLTDCRGISGAGLDFISRIPSLRNLKMDRTGIDSITNLAKLPQLNSISLTSNTVNIEDVLKFAGRYDFELKNSAPDTLPMGSTYYSYDSYDFDCIKVIATLAGEPWAGDLSSVKLEGFSGLGRQHLASFKPSVVELSLARSQLKEELFGVISTWSNLTNLNLEGCNVTDSDLKQIGLCTNLSILALDSTAIDDDGLKHLSMLTDLTWLELNDTGVTHASLPVISGFTKLERLELPFIPEANELLKLLAACPNLNALSCNISNVKRRVSSRHYAFVPDFEVNSQIGITLGDAPFTPDQLKCLLNLSSVYRLSGRTLDDSHCEIINNAPSLESLDFSGSRVTDAGVTKLAGRRRWKDLDFTNTQITLQGIDQLRKSGTRVGTLRIDSTADTAAFINVIRELKGLTMLGYPFSRLSKADASEILAWCADHPLELHDNGNDSGLLNFDLIPWMLGKSAYATDATNVHLNGALIDDAKLSEFTPSPNLQHIIVSNVACSSSRLIEKLLECKGLAALELYNVPLDIEAILKLKNLRRLRTLQLIDCAITDGHLAALNELSRLHELILDANQITGEGLQSFTLARQLDFFSLKKNPLSPSAKDTLQELTQQCPYLRVEP